MRTFVFLFLPVLFTMQNISAQNKTVDSLKEVLQTEKEDTNKVKTYCELIRVVRSYDYDEAKKLIADQIALSKKLHYVWGIGRAQNTLGIIAYEHRDFNNGRIYFTQAIASFVFIKDYNWLCSVYNNVSLLYSMEGMGDSSIYFSHVAESYNKMVKDSVQNLKNKMSVYASLSAAFYEANQYDSCVYYDDETIKIADKFNDLERMADCYATNGQVLMANKQYKEAEQNALKALEIYEKVGYANMVYQMNSALGSIYISMGKYNESKKFSQLSIQQELEQKDSALLMQNYLNLGLDESGEYNYEDALKYFSTGLAAGKELDGAEQKELLEQYTGETYLKLKDYNNAIVYFQKAIAEDTANQKIKYECLATMSLAYERLHEFEKAVTALRESDKIKNTIFDSVKNKTINELIQKYASEKKQQQIEQLATEKKIEELKITKQQQDIISAELIASSQQQQLNIQNLQIQKNNADIEKKALAIKASYTQLQSEKKEKKLQSEITLKENQQKNFAYTGIAFITVLSGFGFYRYQKRRKLQSQQEMLNERLRISRELHDDIGSTLGSISIYSEVAKNRYSKNENAEEAVAKIGNASRELIDKMSDIVWSINPKNESFEQLQNRMQVFAAIMLTPHEILYTVNANEQVKHLNLTTEERKNIYLIYKEAIHNIIKYAGCSQVEIIMRLSANEFTMSISDNGKGFDVNNVLQSNKSLGGNGIKNMRARAESIKADFNIQSSVNSGTIVNFSLKV